MTSLRNIQALVRDAVFETDSARPALAAIGKHIKPSGGLSSEEHLLIYRRAILGTLVRALGDIYPVSKRLVGDQFFDGMARVFARESPSQSSGLADFGASFDDFVAAFEPVANLPYLPDVARLEWRWHLAFHAADEATLDPAVLATVAEDDMSRIVFRLPTSASLIASDYPVNRIWEVNQDDWLGEPGVDLDEGGMIGMVWRRQYDMRIDTFDESTWIFLNAIAAGTSFADLATAEFADRLNTLLPHCVQRGWIAGFDLI